MQYKYFQDFDAFSSSVSDVNCKMLLHNPKQYSWSLWQIDISGFHIQQGCEGSGNITEGQSLLDGYVFFLPFNNFGAHVANGITLDSSSLVILEPGCEFCIRCKTKHNWSSVFVPTFYLLRDIEFVDPSSGSEQTKCRVIHSIPQLIKRLRTLVLSIITTSTNYLNFESTPAASSAAAEVVRVASLIVGQRQGAESKQKGRSKLPRLEIIRHSKNLLEERDGKPVFVEELAAVAQVSERTVRTAFNEYFGIGPLRYLQLRQLNQVNRALQAAVPEETLVSDVLLEHGVWEFGRFASRYRKLFGERPSETLRRKKTKIFF